MSTITKIEGLEIAKVLLEDQRRAISKLDRKINMAIIVVGDKNKIGTENRISTFKSVGLISQIIRISDSDNVENVLITELDRLNNDDKIDCYYIEKPISSNINMENVIKYISPNKDLGGFHPENIGKVSLNIETVLPVNAHTIMQMFSFYNIDLENKVCTIISKSKVNNLPLSVMLSQNDNCSVTICNAFTKDLEVYTKKSDIVIVDVSIPNFLTGDMVKEDSIIVDCGYNRSDGTFVGDVDFVDASNKSSYITPFGSVEDLKVVSLIKNALFIVRNN